MKVVIEFLIWLKAIFVGISAIGLSFFNLSYLSYFISFSCQCASILAEFMVLNLVFQTRLHVQPGKKMISHPYRNLHGTCPHHRQTGERTISQPGRLVVEGGTTSQTGLIIRRTGPAVRGTEDMVTMTGLKRGE